MLLVHGPHFEQQGSEYRIRELKNLSSYKHLKSNIMYQPLHLISHTKAITKDEKHSKGRQLENFLNLQSSPDSAVTRYRITSVVMNQVKKREG